MATSTSIDPAVVRAAADRLRQGAEELRDRRRRLLDRLATGTSGTVPDKSRDGVKVLMGTVDHPHTGAQAGELVAQRVKECADTVTALEDGMRAMATLAHRMADALQTTDELGAEELNRMLTGLYYVTVVVDGHQPDPVDWFGLGGRS